MLLETLLWECFAAPAHLSDSELKAVVQYAKGASLAAFRLDSPAFRRAMEVTSEQLCDGLFLGLQKVGDEEPRVHCLFVELKGRNIPHAIEQLFRAMSIVQTHLKGSLPESAFGRTRFSAVIVSDRASPQRLSPQDIRPFLRSFNSPLYIRSAQRRGAPADLSEDIWRFQEPSNRSV